MRYVPSLNGVLLSHSNARFDQRTALIQPETPFMKCSVTFDCVVWSPRIGMKLSGYHSISSPSHMSLLAHKTFNISIPSSHIPQLGEGQPDGSAGEETFQFVFGVSKSAPEKDEDMAEDETGAEADDYAFPEEEKGNWVSFWTGQPISGPDGARLVEFTVIGLTIANSMLSLIGSLQPDPFDSRHSLTATEALATHPVFRRIEAEQEADDIDEVEREISINLGPTSVSAAEDVEDEIREDWTQDLVKEKEKRKEDEIREDWTQDLVKEKEKRKEDSPAPMTSPAPEPTVEVEKPPTEKSTKKRKRKDNLKDQAAAPAGEVEAGDKPPKKKKKKKSTKEIDGEAKPVEGTEGGAMDVEGEVQTEEGTKEKKKKKKRRREVEVALEA